MSNMPQDNTEIAPPSDGTLRITTNGHGKYRLETYLKNLSCWMPCALGAMDSIEEVRAYAAQLKRVTESMKKERAATWTQVEFVQ